MERPYPHNAPYCICLLLLVLISAGSSDVCAQAASKDSSLQQHKNSSISDSVKKTTGQLLQFAKSRALESYTAKLEDIKAVAQKPRLPATDSIKIDFDNPFRNLLKTKPAIGFKGGFTSYLFNYRSAIDTPYIEKDVIQHNLTGRLNFAVAGQFPVQVNYWIRKSNSAFFKDIADIQVSFSAAEYKNELQSSLQNRLLALSGGLKDSLTEKIYALKNLRLLDLKNILNTSFSPQSLIEAREILNVPGVTYDPRLPDSTNKKREEELRKSAASLLELYDKTKREYDRVEQQVDSLKGRMQQNLEKIKRFRQKVSGLKNESLANHDLRNTLDDYGLQQIELPAKYRWIMGVRNFSLGRTTANYSELTARNISVNGINFEYNSWYYVAVMAGTVNYRFRDFVVNGFNKKPQTLYLLRAGIGRLEKNYFILSGYRGQKQLFASGAANTSVITITGISAETKWQLSRTTWITAEVAKSMAPDFRNNPPEKRTEFNFSDKTNQAVAARLYTYIPATGTRVEAFYKHSGANFQSFSSFQTNAALESWYVKAEQNLFNRRLRFSASLRKNEFTNPFIVQQYKSNTVFKSITASLRMRKWPVITVGYQPMSQLTVLDNHIEENRFQSLVASLYHLYKIKLIQTATTIMVNRFYNSSTDTGFLYYNATNLYWVQNLFFNRFAVNVGASYTHNPGYTISILDAGIQPQIGKTGTMGAGIKINNLDNDITKVGGYLNAGVRIYKQDMLYVSYEHGYLPGFNKKLVSNEMATIQFVKMFR